MAEWKKVIVSGSTAELAGLTLSAAVNAGTDTDKFLVLDSSGNVDFRTGTQVLSDIGAGAGSGDITSVVAGSGLTGGATSGDATLNVGAGDGISVAADTVAVDATVLRTTGDGVVSGSAQISLGGDLSGTANSATVAKVQGVALTSGDATQLANINSTTISSTQWGYVGNANQNVRTTDSPIFVDGTFTGDVSVAGDLVVQGDLTSLQTTNLNIEDQFILINSGSADAKDAGFIFANRVTGAGQAFFYDTEANRPSWATEVEWNATAVVPTAYIARVFDTDAAHTPVDERGSIKVSGGDVFIYV